MINVNDFWRFGPGARSQFDVLAGIEVLVSWGVSGTAAVWRLFGPPSESVWGIVYWSEMIGSRQCNDVAWHIPSTTFGDVKVLVTIAHRPFMVIR